MPAIGRRLLSGQVLFLFLRRSQHLRLGVLALAVIVGAIPLQRFELEMSGKLSRHGFLRVVTAIQYAVALTVFFAKLTFGQLKLSPDELALVTKINKRW